jgi:hypothetical protein
MTTAEWIARLQHPGFKFNAAQCRQENVSLKEAAFLRFLLLNAPAANSEVANFGPGLAYKVMRAGYAVNPLGRKGDEETNLWMLTPAGVELLRRLADERRSR